MNDIIKYQAYNNEIINILSEAIYDSELKYSCWDLFAAGIDNNVLLHHAILTGFKVLNRAGINPRNHFKHIFVTRIETGEINDDWRMSRLGYLLVLMHASGDSIMLNRIKVELMKLL